MKLRFKIPLLFSAMTLIVFLLIIGFLKIYFEEYYFQFLTERSKELVQEDFATLRQVDRLQKDPKQLQIYLKQRTEGKLLQLIYQANGAETSIRAGHLEQGYLTIRKTYPVYENERPVGTLSIIRQPKLWDFGIGPLINQTVLVLLSVLLVLFVLLTIYFYYFITKPIYGLNRRLSQVSLKRKPLLPTYKRKDEISTLYKQVYHMEQRLFQAHEEQIHMISSITHDLKTPLTSIQGFVELLESGAASDEEKRCQYMKLIKQKAEDMNHLLDVFSSYTKNEYTLLDIKTTPIQAKAFFESVAEEYEAELSGLGYTFRSQHVFDETDMMDGHPDLLRRIVANLVSNAMRYAHHEDLTLVFTGFKEEDRACFVIEDNGAGVPEEEICKLFSKFYTLDRARQREKGGTGLGLAICRSIARRHGGTILAFRSRYGGLGVKLTIPLKQT